MVISAQNLSVAFPNERNKEHPKDHNFVCAFISDSHKQ